MINFFLDIASKITPIYMIMLWQRIRQQLSVSKWSFHTDRKLLHQLPLCAERACACMVVSSKGSPSDTYWRRNEFCNALPATSVTNNMFTSFFSFRPVLTVDEKINEHIFVVVILQFYFTRPYEHITTTKIFSLWLYYYLVYRSLLYTKKINK